MPRLLLACAAAVAIGCGAPSAAPQPNVAAWTPPPDWVTVSTPDGGLQLTLPPWLQTFDNTGAIFASEPPPVIGAPIPMQLMALGPRADDQPAPGQDLVAWLEGRLQDTGQGKPIVSRVSLPAGPAVRFDRTDRAGTLMAWRLMVFAIESPIGVAYLQFDGPPDGWPARLADLEHVATLFRFR